MYICIARRFTQTLSIEYIFIWSQIDQILKHLYLTARHYLLGRPSSCKQNREYLFICCEFYSDHSALKGKVGNDTTIQTFWRTINKTSFEFCTFCLVFKKCFNNYFCELSRCLLLHTCCLETFTVSPYLTLELYTSCG